MTTLFHDRRNRCHTQSSAALVIVLAMIVLVTIAVLTFLSSATFNRHIESNRTDRAQADLLADSGAAYAIGLIMSQITNPDRSTITTTSGVSIFEPNSSTNAWIERTFPSGGISLKDPTFFNLIRQSVPTVDTNASADNTGQAASSGQTLSTTRWNEPQLLTGSGFTATNQIPNWIYVNNTVGATNTASSSVIGRFAYNIYNIGGLLNANEAGYPSGVAANAVLMTYLKANQSGADLTQLTNSSGVGPYQTDVDTLATFRFPDNPATSTNTATAATNYVGRMLGASTNGYLSVQNYDWFQGTSFKQNMFSSRQDLIRYATTQNNGLTNALPYLTHFSRSVNAPSYYTNSLSTISVNYDIPNVRFSVAGTITHLDDKGGATTYSVNAGDPLVQRRFSLAKLAWLTYKGPSADLVSTDSLYNAGGTDANIQAGFGLAWNSGQERWDYVGPTGSTLQSSIENLTQIAAETTPRELNFFETLKAGILSKTLGGEALAGCDYYNNTTTQCTNGMSLCPAANNLLDVNKDLHVVQIGANIIDNADADNYPTRIGMQFGSIVIEKAGVEDLPYISCIDMPVFMQTTAATVLGTNVWNIPTLAFVWVPELFEPHRPSTTTSGPVSIQVNFLTNSILHQVGFAQNTAFSAGISSSVLDRDLGTLPPIQVSSNNFETYRTGPQPVRSSGAANSLDKIIPSFFTTNSDVLGFQMANYSNSSDFPPGLPMQMTQKPYLAFLQAQGVILRLQYTTPGGQLKTYSTLGGNEALPTTTGIWGLSRDDFGTTASPIPILKQTEGLNNNGYLATTPGQSTTLNYVNSCRMITYDPRGNRFGPSQGSYCHFMAQVPLFVINGPAGNPETFTANSFYPTTYYNWNVNAYMGNLPQFTAFQDGDGVARMPDGGFGYSSTNSAGNATNIANPYVNVTNSAGYPARPVILQRPYRSVAELGYVYRDVPWETLNFFNNTSGDSPLLDMFSVTDEPAVTSGRVFLATQQLPVLAALMSGAPQEWDGTLPLTTTNTQTVTSSIKNYLYLSLSGRPSITAGQFPVNAADLVNYMSSANMSTMFPKGTNAASMSLIKNRREVVPRILGSATQMRTWNIFVDVVAQTGRFPGQSFTAGDFVVEGQSHCWVSVAIDRYTGKIVDEQFEKVSE